LGALIALYLMLNSNITSLENKFEDDVSALSSQININENMLIQIAESQRGLIARFDQLLQSSANAPPAQDFPAKNQADSDSSEP
jgi:hypothetical protein